jgi:hypothetical protein
MESSKKLREGATTTDGVEEPQVMTATTNSERARSNKDPDERTRLVVELSPMAAAMLNELCDLEHLNKTTVVNRAIQVYHLLRMAEAAGGQVLLSESKDGSLQRVRFI